MKEVRRGTAAIHFYIYLTCFIPSLVQLDGRDNSTKGFEWGLAKPFSCNPLFGPERTRFVGRREAHSPIPHSSGTPASACVDRLPGGAFHVLLINSGKLILPPLSIM